MSPESQKFTRRRFIGSCTLCSACMALTPLSSMATATRTQRMKIRLIYALHDIVQPGPDWPNVGFNFEPVMEHFTTTLTDHCQNFEFVTAMAKGPEEAEKILKMDRSNGVSGYVVFQMNCWNRVVQTIAKSARPVLYVDFEYAGSGGFLGPFSYTQGGACSNIYILSDVVFYPG